MPTGDQGGIVYVGLILIGAGLSTFVVSTLVPWWLAKPVVIGGSAITIALRIYGRFTKVYPTQRVDNTYSNIVGIVTGIIALAQLLRWGSYEFILTMAAGINARKAEKAQ